MSARKFLVVADDSATPAWVAADLLAQAEHDPLACSLLITPDHALAEAVDREVAEQVQSLPRRSIVEESLAGRGEPDASAIRAGYANLRPHMEYLGWLAENRKWIAGSAISLADFAAAGHLSALDFAGDIDWTVSEAARDWYARMKSRPSFRGILADRVPGVVPPPHYADLDF